MQIIIIAKEIYRSLRSFFRKATVLSYQDEQRKAELEKMADERRKSIRSGMSLTEDQKQAIDTLYINSYGKKIPYDWHLHYMAFTGRFDVNYFPELLYIPEFEFYMNQKPEYAQVLSDKNFISMVAESAGIQIPKVKLTCTCGVFRDAENNLIHGNEAERLLENAGKTFLKPSVDSGSGRGCRLADFHEGRDVISKLTVEDVLRELGSDFTAQEIIRCSKDIQRIYDKCVNTFRVISYIWKDKIHTMPIIMRIGHGGAVLDNAHAGGMFIAVDDNGELHETAFTEFRDEYSSHPDSGVVFKGYSISGVPSLIESAKRLHACIPQVGVVNWDFTLDEENKPVLVEANIQYGSVWLSEMAHGKGPFGERTKEVLMWLSFMNSIPSEEYKYHRYGWM